ncbi:hypothetical protein Dxin01_02851 [Deinococcus xinjiangensis]|uniref:Uncharacterized protein n=1 Tax=Deinococcus xinjiangensis TaxID=457454 RepID=A0ABP9VCZ8_9DEIO
MMRRMLTLACLALTTAALAGGAGGPVAPRPVAPFGTPAAPRTLPATSLVKPAQTWVMNGVTAEGEQVSDTYKLDAAPPKWDDGWDFEAEDMGMVSYDPANKNVFIGNITQHVVEEKPLHICLAVIEGQQVRGLLFAGETEEINAELNKLAKGAPEGALSYAQLVQVVKKTGVNAGTCTFTRK